MWAVVLYTLGFSCYGSCLRNFESSTPQKGPTCENMHFRHTRERIATICAPPKSYYPRMSRSVESQFFRRCAPEPCTNEAQKPPALRYAVRAPGDPPHHSFFPHRSPKELTWAACHKTLLFQYQLGGDRCGRAQCFPSHLQFVGVFSPPGVAGQCAVLTLPFLHSPRLVDNKKHSRRHHNTGRNG